MDIIYSLSLPFAIITYSMVITAVISGLLKVKMKVHKTLAIIAGILATLHGTFMLLTRLGVL